MSDSVGLTPEELAELTLPPLPKQYRRIGRAARVSKADLDAVTTSKAEKNKITAEEYQRRLYQSTLRDSKVYEQATKRRTQAAVTEWLRAVPPRFAKADIVDNNPIILDRVNRVLTGRGTHQTSLIFYGATGVGKSWNAYGYLNRLVTEGAVLPGQIVHGTETNVLGRISSAGFNRSPMLEELRAPSKKVYFIDDVGVGYFSNDSSRHDLWYVLTDHVYSNDLTLIVTTNLTGKTLPNWLGFRAWERLDTLVGNAGKIEPGKVNRRAGVAEAKEQEYLS